MLATEETKTVWRATNGREYENRREAEHDSVKEVVNCAATLVGNVDLGVFIQELSKHPEAKDWLLEQLNGKSQIVDFPNTLAYAYSQKDYSSSAKSTMLRELAIDLEQRGYQLIKK